MTMEEMGLPVTSVHFNHSHSSAQSPTGFLGFYIGYLIREMTDLGYDLDDLPRTEDPVEVLKDRYQIDFNDLSIRECEK